MAKNKGNNNGGNMKAGGNMKNAEVTNVQEAIDKNQNAGNNKKNQGAQNTK